MSYKTDLDFLDCFGSGKTLSNYQRHTVLLAFYMYTWLVFIIILEMINLKYITNKATEQPKQLSYAAEEITHFGEKFKSQSLHQQIL